MWSRSRGKRDPGRGSLWLFYHKRLHCSPAYFLQEGDIAEAKYSTVKRGRRTFQRRGENWGKDLSDVGEREPTLWLKVGRNS